MSVKKKKKLTQKQQLWLMKFRKEDRQERRKYEREMLGKTTLQQRKTFMEALWAGKGFGDAAKLAGFLNEKGEADIVTALVVWKRNTKRVCHTVMLTVDQVR